MFKLQQEKSFSKKCFVIKYRSSDFYCISQRNQYQKLQNMMILEIITEFILMICPTTIM